jgi:hypothetical protein
VTGSILAAVRRRTLALGAFLVIAAIAYVIVFVVAKTDVVFGEATFDSEPTGSQPLDLYVDVTAIDPVRQSMDMRLDVATGARAHGRHYFGRLDRDVELRISDGEAEQDFQLRRGRPLSSAEFVASFRGTVGRYPFDTYATAIVVSATELSSMGAGKIIPVHVTVWEGVPAWLLRVTKAHSLDAAQGLTLTFDAHRPAGLVFFSCVIYGLMVLIALCAVAIGALTFIGKRRIEVTLVGALTGMVFALPILRNALPGAPPLGIPADILILLWAEVAAIVGLTLLVMTWIRRGPEP